MSWTPGAGTSGLRFGSLRFTLEPMDEKGAMRPEASTAPTAMANETKPGLSTSPSSNMPPSFPADAMRNTPRSSAHWADRETSVATNRGALEPNETEMMSAPRVPSPNGSTHSRMPSATAEELPNPAELITLATIRETSG